MPYTVLYPLWSDGAEKSRFIELPQCGAIDTTDPDHWSFPVGTKIWKEFRVGAQRIETRFIKRFGPGPSDFLFVSYAWDAGETEATAVPGGVTAAGGTTHDIPAQWECVTCHERVPERVLGFGTVELSHGGAGWTVASLIAAQRTTTVVPEYVVPGDASTSAAIGYLHANCGFCHNRTVDGEYFPNPYDLRLSVTATTLAQTGVFQTAVNVPVDNFSHPGITHRIKPGDPNASCVTYRMGQRGNSDQMPPFATKQVDPTALAAMTSWISSLTP
jgi:hypothetical protein